MSENGNWTSKKSSGKEVNFKFEKEGESLVGHFMGSIHDVGTKKNSSIHTIKKTDDTEVNFWGSMVMDDQLGNIPFGSLIKIDYLGKKENKKKTDSYHNFEVFVDESVEPLVEAGTAPTNNAPELAASSNGTFEDSGDLPFE